MTSGGAKLTPRPSNKKVILWKGASPHHSIARHLCHARRRKCREKKNLQYGFSMGQIKKQWKRSLLWALFPPQWNRLKKQSYEIVCVLIYLMTIKLSIFQQYSRLSNRGHVSFFYHVLSHRKNKHVFNRGPKKFSLCLNSKGLREKREDGKGKTQHWEGDGEELPTIFLITVFWPSHPSFSPSNF